MTTLPIPFLTAILLLILAGANHHHMQTTPTGRLFAIFLYVNVVAMVCIGFRWSHDLVILLVPAAALAVLSSALLYLAFRSLGRLGPVVALSRDWPHLIPLVLIVVTVSIHPRWTELVLVATKLVYAVLLMLLARRAPGSLQLVRLHWLNNSLHALWGAIVLLLLSVFVDIAVAVDFALYEGRHAASVVGTANMFTVCLLGWASVMAGRGMSLERHVANTTVAQAETNSSSDLAAYADPVVDWHQEKENESAVNANDATDEHARLLKHLNHLLVDQRLYADTELNLQKLARKAGVPTRMVSRAINDQTGKNVSQWVNSARVDAVCELLLDRDVSVTEAMLEVGFLTKSNFNREFRRLKGCSPSQWRAEH